MGCQFSKQLTEALGPIKAELGSIKTEIGSIKTEIGSIKTEIGSIKTEIGSIKTEIGSIIAVLLVPDGDEEARQATVILSTSSENGRQEIVGHGVVVRAPNHQRLGDPGYYLLSAAHVLVDIANDMKENGCSLLVSWSQNDGTRHDFVETTHGALILHRDYILKGSHDYGFMELKSLTQETFRTETKTLRLCSPRVGESVVARGRVFLRGTVTGVLEDSPRFSVLAHSIPGSSGAPVFNNERQLAGVVHGSSKHKGHSYGNIAEDAAVAYADIILVTDGLFQICDIHWNWLRKAEFVPPEVASGKTGLSRTETTRQDQVEVQTEGTEALWDLCNEMNMEYNFMSEVTLKMIMEELTKQVVKAENQTTWWEDREFELVVVSDSTQTI